MCLVTLLIVTSAITMLPAPARADNYFVIGLYLHRIFTFASGEHVQTFFACLPCLALSIASHQDISNFFSEGVNICLTIEK